MTLPDKKLKKEVQKIVDRAAYEHTGDDVLLSNDTDEIIELVRSHDRQVVEEILAYTQHDNDCILSMFEAGRPIANGGYEQKYKGKWYQSRPVDKTPKCECGLDDIRTKLTALRGKEKV